MLKKILLLFFIGIIISVLYLTEGCNVLKPAPTPTPTPTITPANTQTPISTPTIFLSDRLPVANKTPDATGSPSPVCKSVEMGYVKEIYGNWATIKSGGLFDEDIEITPNEMTCIIWLVKDKDKWTRRASTIELYKAGSNFSCTESGGPVHFYKFKIIDTRSESSDGTKTGPVLSPTPLPGQAFMGVTIDYDTGTGHLITNLYQRKK